MENKTDLLELLKYIDPSSLTYNEWAQVGMALKHEGYTAYDWDTWSSSDSRHVPGECYKKWETFNEESGSVVTGGTIYQYARDAGWNPPSKDEGHALDWDSVIGDDLVVVDQHWLEGQELIEPTDEEWNPTQDLITYLETLFQSTDYVGYVTESRETDKGKYVPSSTGAFDRTAGALITSLRNNMNDLGATMGDFNPDVGAWIRFNPLDSKGVKNDNVTDFKYALVESDELEIDKQNAIIRELELPVACLVSSGGKSVHAIVKIEAETYEEYRKRVNYLFDVCNKNGLKIDTQNRNPSRLSRMPGVTRKGKKQFLIDTNIGKESWKEWEEWIEAVNDDLPDVESLADFWDDLPPLAPPLIHGVLRQGHKLLISGPSKAGKSFALIEMAICIAEGKKWFGFDCAQGRILYVNLELDRASCLHRFKDVYQGLEIAPKHFDNIDIWNLRGKTLPMDKLAPKLIRRAQKKGYIAVIIDPIYKVITGDENSADQMAAFCNQFDKVCNELGAATIYCHHHSKGSQGGKKSVDRASGSGVFARDPDAILDLIELEITDGLRTSEINKAKATAIAEFIKKNDYKYYENEVGIDDMMSEYQMRQHALECISREDRIEMDKLVAIAEQQGIGYKTAWRIEGTLREFASFDPVNLWFDYPIHRLDNVGILKDLDSEGAQLPWIKGSQKGGNTMKKKAKQTEDNIRDAILNANFGEPPTVAQVKEYMEGADLKGASDSSIKRFLKENSDEFEKVKNENDKYVIQVVQS